MIAALPMYDWPEVREATDAWWQGLAGAFRREGLTDVPERLYRGSVGDNADIGDIAKVPDLLFGQTCGYPYTHGGSASLRLVATPCYRVEGCRGSDYQSLVLCRREARQTGLGEFRGSTAVVNDVRSQSGYSALRAVVAPLADRQRFFREVAESGSHRRSMEMLGQGKADICAVDCVCYALARRHVPHLLAPLRVIATSPRAPGLPYVTMRQSSDDLVMRLRGGLMSAMNAPELADIRAALFLSGAEILTDSDYQRIIDIERSAIRLDYPELV